MTHLHPMTPSALLRDRFTRGRDFGRTRLENQRWSKVRCFAHLAAAPVLPIVMTLRAAGYAAPSGRLAEWAFFAPAQALAHSFWCCGEFRANWEALWGR